MVTPGTYRIRNVQSRTILDLGKVEWVNVIGWEQNGRDNQLWYVQREGGKFFLKNCAAGNYASVYNHHKGTRVHGCGNPLPWELIDSGHGYFIGTPGKNRVMELNQGLKINGTQVFVRERTGGEHQKWYFEKINDDPGPRAACHSQPQHEHLPQNQPFHGYQPQPQEQYIPPPQTSQPPSQAQAPQQNPNTVNPGTYMIRNVLTGTVLDRWGDAGNTHGAPVGCRYNGGINQQVRALDTKKTAILTAMVQQWILSSTNNGQSVSICSQRDNGYASLSELGSLKISLNAEDFTLVYSNNGYYISPSLRPTHALELPTNTGQVTLKLKTSDPSQKWRFESCMF
ncbi:unnamed protein product [Rhizoctonia solani]|uniref:Ricin B lectin domain-containing protein n=1 Tax=Rhizoctonia solani TaxID=456999 RepID=A0A8H3ASJ8_9AGAM|nr:unnamed protein product [Rhizoctonia solani]